MRLQAEVAVIGDVVVVRCRGRIIFGDEVSEIAKKVVATNPSTRFVIIDLSNVNELRKGDLGELWLGYMRARALGWRVVLADLSKELRDLMVTHAIESAFEVYTDEVSAMQVVVARGEAITAA